MLVFVSNTHSGFSSLENKSSYCFSETSKNPPIQSDTTIADRVLTATAFAVAALRAVPTAWKYNLVHGFYGKLWFNTVGDCLKANAVDVVASVAQVAEKHLVLICWILATQKMEKKQTKQEGRCNFLMDNSPEWPQHQKQGKVITFWTLQQKF